MHEDLAGPNGERYELRYSLTVPAALPDLDLATIRPRRAGGVTPADEQFRAELFARVGAVTVAAGEVDTAMKRLLVLLRGDAGGFSLVETVWTDLQKALVAQCTGADDRRIALAEVLEWGEQQGVKRKRDDVIHSSWWLYAGCGVRRSRFARKSDGQIQLSSFDQLEEAAEILFEYADRLDALLSSDWPIATLPPL